MCISRVVCRPRTGLELGDISEAEGEALWLQILWSHSSCLCAFTLVFADCWPEGICEPREQTAHLAYQVRAGLAQLKPSSLFA